MGRAPRSFRKRRILPNVRLQAVAIVSSGLREQAVSLLICPASSAHRPWLERDRKRSRGRRELDRLLDIQEAIENIQRALASLILECIVFFLVPPAELNT